MPVLATYMKPEDAHLAASLLEGNGIEAYLRDENLASLHLFYSNAIGGVKLEVAEEDYERAHEILNLPKESSDWLTCPHCGSENVRVREMSLLSALALIFLSLILPQRKHPIDCLDCSKSFTRE